MEFGTLFAPSRLGYDNSTTVIRSLHERMVMALDQRADDIRSLLRKYGVSYRIDTPNQIMQFVAFLDKPLADILDELKIPRERIVHSFIEFHGPLPYNPNKLLVRKIVPGVIKSEGLGVQPMSLPTSLAFMVTLRALISVPPQIGPLELP